MRCRGYMDRLKSRKLRAPEATASDALWNRNINGRAARPERPWHRAQRAEDSHGNRMIAVLVVGSGRRTRNGAFVLTTISPKSSTPMARLFFDAL